jgi:polysaccharide biosynthesis protein VpsM
MVDLIPFQRSNRQMAFLLLTVIHLLICPSSCSLSLADEGKIEINPHIQVKTRMDSNFWKTETSEREVFSIVVKPGITFGYKTDRTKIHLDYTMNGYLYSDRDTLLPGERKASNDNYMGHTLRLQASTLQLDERLRVGLQEHFDLTRNPAQSDRFTDSVLREKYLINRVTPFAFYELSDRFTLGIRYRNTITDYFASYMEDSTENRGIIDLIYNTSESSSLDLDYQVWARNYNKNTSAYLSNQIMLAFRKHYRLLSFEAAAGYQYRSFEQEKLESMDIIPWHLGIQLATDPTPIDPLVPVQRKNSFLRLSVDQDFNNQGLNEGYFKADRLTLEAAHVFFKRIPVSLRGYYQKSRYNYLTGMTSSGTIALRDDDTYKIYCSFGYMFLRWFTISLEPGYERRHSNILGAGYEDKYIMAQLSFYYNLSSD